MAVEDSGARSARREPRPAAWDDEDERWLEGERAAWAARLRDLPVEDSHQALERLRVERIELLGDDAHRVLRRAEVAAGAGVISLAGGELRVGERPAGRKRSGAFYTPPPTAPDRRSNATMRSGSFGVVHPVDGVQHGRAARARVRGNQQSVRLCFVWMNQVAAFRRSRYRSSPRFIHQIQ
jgi:hypothetical protein